MGNFKFEKYDYTKIGIKKKFFLRYEVSNNEYDVLTRVLHETDEEIVNTLVNGLKHMYVSENYTKPGYNLENFDWEWEIITPNRTYKSNETSSKKE